MAASGGEDFMSDEIVTNKCCVCASNNKRTEAVKFCVDCKDYFCTSCVKIHAAIPATQGHTMLDKSNFKSVRSGAGYLPSFPTQRCDQHKSEVLNMYCQDHDKVGCATCIAIDHRSCKRIFSIPEKIDNLYKRSEISNVEQKISSLGKEIEAVKKAKEVHLQEISKCLQTAVDSVKTFKQELQILFNKIEEETISELRKEFKRIENSVADEIKNAVNLINQLKKMTAQLKITEGNKVEEFVCAKTFSTLNKKYEEDFNLQQRQSNETFSFAADQSIKQFLQQIKSFGKVTCQTSFVPETRLAVKPQTSTPTVIPTKTTLYKVTNQRKANVKLPDDTKDCTINGSCVTEDGSLLLVDYGNQKLKRLNLYTETVTDFINLIAKPRAVCQVSKTEAAVSLNIKTVQFVALGDKLTATRTLTFDHVCGGLAYSSRNLFIADGKNSVYIHDINGKELRKVTINASGKDIFRYTRHITVSADGSKVFVADLDNGLITLDIRGNYLSTLSEIQASGCYGVCTDGSNVFVCGFQSNNVVQIGQDHKLSGQISTIDFPTSVCFDSQKRRLFVTSRNDVIELELI